MSRGTEARDRLRAAAHARLVRETGATSIGRLCPHCGSDEHGRPRAVGAAPPVHVSITYAGDLAVAAWSHDGPIGVDVELAGTALDVAPWTRTEALLKAAGTGVRGLDAPLPDLPTAPVEGLPDGYVGTVAAPDPGRVGTAVVQASGRSGSASS